MKEDGARKQQWRGGFPTRREAERELTRILRTLQTGEYVTPTNETLGDFLVREWLPSVRATVRPTTFRSYEMHVRMHIQARLGSTPLQRLTGAQINAFYADLAASGRHRGNAPLSPATVRRVHAVLHRALRDAVRWDRLPRNPADLADPPRQRASSSREMTTWTPGEAERFLDHVADDRVFALWVFLLTTGVRRGEAAGLRWQDVDLDSGRAAIKQARVAVGYEVQVAAPKTGRSRRSVALDPDTVAILRAHRKVQMEERLFCGPGWEETGLVFVQPDGSAIHPDRITKLFDRAVRESGLPRIRLHDIRHTHATLALQAGLHPKVVSDRLGHSSTTVTLDIYSHVIPALQEEAATTVASMFLKLPTNDRKAGEADRQ